MSNIRGLFDVKKPDNEDVNWEGTGQVTQKPAGFNASNFMQTAKKNA